MQDDPTSRALSDAEAQVDELVERARILAWKIERMHTKRQAEGLAARPRQRAARIAERLDAVAQAIDERREANLQPPLTDADERRGGL